MVFVPVAQAPPKPGATESGVDTKMWALLRSQGAKSDSVSIKWFDTGTTCHVQALSNNLILASYII